MAGALPRWIHAPAPPAVASQLQRRLALYLYEYSASRMYLPSSCDQPLMPVSVERMSR